MTPLAKAILDYTSAHQGHGEEFRADVPGLVLYRADGATSLEHAFYDSALIVIVQGAKEVMLGRNRLRYGPGQYLVLHVGMPVRASITEATRDVPYLALSLKIELPVINELMGEIGPVPPDRAQAETGIDLAVRNVGPHQENLLSRLAEVLNMPQALRVLYPSIAREMMYWTLVGHDGEDVRRLATPTSHMRRIAEALNAMRTNYASSYSIEGLAQIANMSVSSFYQHFKAITSMSPLQYQKQMRLIEARRFMLTSGANVARAAYHVGYESPSQFSREYSRFFGDPPRRDLMKDRNTHHRGAM